MLSSVEESPPRRNFLRVSGAAALTPALPEITHSKEDAFGSDFDGIIALPQIGKVNVVEEALLSRLEDAK